MSHMASLVSTLWTRMSPEQGIVLSQSSVPLGEIYRVWRRWSYLQLGRDKFGSTISGPGRIETYSGDLERNKMLTI